MPITMTRGRPCEEGPMEVIRDSKHPLIDTNIGEDVQRAEYTRASRYGQHVGVDLKGPSP